MRLCCSLLSFLLPVLLLAAAEPSRHGDSSSVTTGSHVRQPSSSGSQGRPAPSHPLLCNPVTPRPMEPATLQSLQQHLLALHHKLDQMSEEITHTKLKVDHSASQMNDLIRSTIRTSCAEVAVGDPLSASPAIPWRHHGAVSRQNSGDGVYAIYPSTGVAKRVKCTSSTTGETGWMVVLLRQTGTVDFKRNLDQYIAGFGDPSAEVWIGLGTLHALTEAQPQQLRIELRNFAGEFAYAHYSHFSVGPKSSHYNLSVGGYDASSTAGDALKDHNNMLFSTIDVDHDKDAANNCAEQFGGGGGWWYATCYHALGTGRYRRPAHPGLSTTSSEYGGVTWFPFSDVKRSLQMFKMLIKPREND